MTSQTVDNCHLFPFPELQKRGRFYKDLGNESSLEFMLSVCQLSVK